MTKCLEPLFEFETRYNAKRDQPIQHFAFLLTYGVQSWFFYKTNVGGIWQNMRIYGEQRQLLE